MADLQRVTILTTGYICANAPRAMVMSPDNISFKVELAGRWSCLLHTRTTYPKTAPRRWGIGSPRSCSVFIFLGDPFRKSRNLGRDIVQTIMQFTAYTTCKLDRYFRHSISSIFLGVVLDFGDQVQVYNQWDRIISTAVPSYLSIYSFIGNRDRCCILNHTPIDVNPRGS
ncbi:hypothetical protein EAF00_009275 [Botryotinia globosa]|nr:hypothetical protein EAF00_009275 [Botryotinia globosa]